MYENTSRFSHHGPCKNCGSKDNVGWYENGSGYCFGCGYFYRGDSTPRLIKKEVVLGDLRAPPDDCNTEYSSKVIEWISKYDLTVADLIKRNIVWSPNREQLIYRFYGEDKDLVLWQARNFRTGTTHKDRFYTQGTPNSVIAAYYPEQAGDTAVVVEDCISAIKIAKGGGVGIPCFGSTLADIKLARIGRIYKTIFFWLDNDKFKEALKLEKKAQNLGCKTRVFSTEQDPKCYSEITIKGMIL